MNLVLRHAGSQTLRLCDRLTYRTLPKCYNPISLTSSCPDIQVRNYCEEKMKSRTTLPQLMEFPPIIWPTLIKFVKNWMFANFIIRPYFEQEFSLTEFIEASKHAVQIVSEALQRSDFVALEGIVEPEAIATLKKSVSTLSVSQREMLAIQKEDIFYAFPYQVGVMFDDKDKRWVEITMCYHVLKGLQRMKEFNELPPLSIGISPEYEEKIFILNYRFIREFTKGVEDSWWVNIVNHFQPRALLKK